MRHLLIILLLPVLLPAHTYGQERQSVDIDETVMSYESTASYRMAARKEKNAYKQSAYWRKYKRLKISGWSMFSIGTAAIITGVLGESIDEGTNSNWSPNNGRAWKGVIYSGVAIAASSVPLLTFAYTNRHKAKKRAAFSLTTSNLLVDLPTGRKQTQPTLGININF